MFNTKRLSLARMRRRLTAKGLAEACDLSPMTITRLEKGENQPDQETILKLATALNFPSAFFFADDPEQLDTNAVSFRSLSKMSAKERDAALAAGSLGLQLSDWIEDRFELPKASLLDLSYEAYPEQAAQSMRQFWKIGEKPVGNMIGLLEQNGVRVFSLSENTKTVDAFSFWRDEKPYVFLNTFKTAEHSIMDTAHELGHLVMHRHGGPRSSRDAEREANQFASAFLMPANDVRARFPPRITVELIVKAKARWRVSAMAMTYRLKNLGLLTDWQYKSTCIELGKRGYRTAEPNGIERETSIVWQKILSQLWSERTSKNEIAEAMHVPLDEFEGLVWGLTSRAPTPARGVRQFREVES